MLAIGQPHPEAHASRSRPIRSRIAANSLREQFFFLQELRCQQASAKSAEDRLAVRQVIRKERRRYTAALVRVRAVWNQIRTEEDSLRARELGPNF